jgi:hypothetical protein
MDGVYFQNEAVQRDLFGRGGGTILHRPISRRSGSAAQRLRSNPARISIQAGLPDGYRAVPGRIVVSLPTRFLRNWIVSHYSDTLAHACEAELARSPRLRSGLHSRTAGPRPAAGTAAASLCLLRHTSLRRDIAQRRSVRSAFGGYRDRSDRGNDRSGDRGSPSIIR